MGWVRQELELAATGKRFPLKGTCLAIYSRVVNAGCAVDEVVQQACSPGAAAGRPS